MRLPITFAVLSSAALIAVPALAQTTPAPAGQTTTPSAPIPVQPTPAATGTVAQTLQSATDHTTLVKLVQAANLGAVFSGPGPITVFAPDDAAFGRLAPGTVDELMKPANVSSATQILKYHVVSGKYTTDDLLKQLKASGGTLTLNTLDGQPLTLTMAGTSAIQLTDALGNKAFVAKASTDASNGVVEYINGVLSPKMMAQPPAPAATTPATPDNAADGAAPAQDDASGS